LQFCSESSDEVKTEVENEEDKAVKKADSKTEDKPSAYSDIPQGLLFCPPCNKPFSAAGVSQPPDIDYCSHIFDDSILAGFRETFEERSPPEGDEPLA
jgi:hypothetical protein